jgi:EAL domain-containing protein (putative c-di-GMP-specific phosphodiesterase class I)
MALPHKRRVLVADDDASVRALLERLLTVSGYEVVVAVDGHQARQIVGQHSFDVIVSDIQMPGLGGLELLQAVRERDLDVPVILVTGSPSVETAVRAIQYGALRYLMKPVEPQVLLDTLAYAAQVHELARLKRDALSALGRQQQAATDLAGLEAALNRAIASLTMHFQPIVSCSRKAIYAYEALARPVEPSLPNPPALLDAAERLGRVHEVGRAIRERVAGGLGELESGQLVFVNLHPNDLTDDSLYSGVAPLSRFAKRVVLEITERASLHGVAELHERLKALRSLGYRFALDDLGAGYAGLTSFVQIAPEVVKIDMELVRGVHQNQSKERVIRSIGELCREMKIEVVAEGVEVRDERVALSGLGIDLLQGYLFAKPQKGFTKVPPGSFE